MNTLTLPTDSDVRKTIPLSAGLLAYFPAALAGVARISHLGNQKHNPGQPLHHARGKSMDHSDCVVRHLMDVNDIQTDIDRNSDYAEVFNDGYYDHDKVDALLMEVSQLAWRALALSQELHERYGNAPLAPGAK